MAKKPVSDQMELFEDGGFKDQGNTKDPISNNPVPVGSTKKEVRDDIPANLSEGEFVLPADVVRYHGLEKIMGFRDQAKQGLEKMENMGQMGNSDQATIPDGVPFQQMAEGGAVPVPTIQQPEVVAQNQVPGVQYVAPTTQAVRPSIYSFNQQMPQVTVPTQPSVTVPTQPNYQTPAYRQSTSTAETPKFSNLLGTQFGQLQESVTKRYVNDAGEEMYIPFVNGEPIYPIPNGFREEAEAEAKKDDPDINKAVQSTSVRQQQSEEDGNTVFDASKSQDYKVAMQLARDDEARKRANGEGSLFGNITNAVGKYLETGVIGQVIDGFKGVLDPDMVTQKYGLTGTDSNAKSIRTGDVYRDRMRPGPQLAEAFEYDKTQGAKASNEALAKASGYASFDAMTKQYGVKPSFKMGNKPGDVSIVTGKPYNFAGQSRGSNGSLAFKSWDAWTDSLSVGYETGWSGGFISEAEIIAAQTSHAKKVAKGVQSYSGTWNREYVDAYKDKMAEKNGGYIDKTMLPDGVTKGPNYGNFVKGTKKDKDSKVKTVTPSAYVEPFDKITTPTVKSTKVSDINKFGMGSEAGVDSANVSTTQDQSKNQLNITANNLGVNPANYKNTRELEEAVNKKRADNKEELRIDNIIRDTYTGSFGRVTPSDPGDGGDSGLGASSSVSDDGLSGWTAQGGFINKRTMTMSKTSPNKKKRGGLASRR